MRCPTCHRNSLVTTNTRLQEDTAWVVRRARKCKHCRRTFISYEMTDEYYERLTRANTVLSGLSQFLGPGRRKPGDENSR